MGAYLIATLLVLGGAYALSRWARWEERRRQAVALAAEIPIRQLEEDAASVAKELGPGSFRQEVKLRGRILCDVPLIAELSKTSCVSYRFSVTREYEEVLWEKDARGNAIQRTHRRSEVVASHEASVPFWLDDGTGRVLVHPEHAKIERVPSHSSFQPAVTGLTVGNFVLATPVVGGTLGYRYEEHCLAVDQEVSIVAEAGDEGGAFALRRPEQRQAPFVITTKTFSEWARGKELMTVILRGVSYGLTAVAVLIFLLGVIR